MTQQEKDQEFLAINVNLMAYYGYEETDMDDDSIEGDVNAEAIDVFFDKFNEEYYA